MMRRIRAAWRALVGRRGSVTIVIETPFLDMNDPKAAEALARALRRDDDDGER